MDSKVEQFALEKSGKDFQFKPHEKIGVIEVDNFPALGGLTVLSFLESIYKGKKFNPDAVDGPAAPDILTAVYRSAEKRTIEKVPPRKG